MNRQYQLWYRQPAEKWEQTLPLGNGRMGAMVFGGTEEETVGLNEDSLWSGYFHDKNNPQAFEHLAAVREKLFAGEYEAAEREIHGGMLSEHTESYLPMGTLSIRTEHSGTAEQYIRALDLETGVASVEYTADGVRFCREYFASYPHEAIVMKFTSSAPAALEVRFSSLLMHMSYVFRQELRIEGRCPEHINRTNADEPVMRQGTKGKEFSGKVRIFSTDGEVSAVNDTALRIDRATETVLVLEAVRPAVLPEQADYASLRAAHVKDYRTLYDTCVLDLGEGPALPTDERLEHVRKGANDPALLALFFSFGRYLMIASSREGSQPANLQGIWNWNLNPAWSSNYTININLEMNYWPALPCNLVPCLLPYHTFMLRMAEEGRKTAQVHYHARGITAHHNMDYWCNTNPVGHEQGKAVARRGSVRWGMWPMGAAWLCEELFSEYAYCRDETFLKEIAYPLIREAALFLLDWVVEHNGEYVTAPSTSPENVFINERGNICSVGISSAMDLSLIREVWGNYAVLCRKLGREQDEVLAEINEKLPKLANFRIGSYGQILEYQDEFEENEPGHRHLSHLYGLFPGELFAKDEKMTEACRRALKHRLENGGGGTGWSSTWVANLLAVLGEGACAEEQLLRMLRDFTADNLWNLHWNHSLPFQIDGNFGGTSAIAQMLVQDRGGEVKYLPALPPSWKNGSVRGLRIKGNRTVDMTWKDGRLVSKTIHEQA